MVKFKRIGIFLIMSITICGHAIYSQQIPNSQLKQHKLGLTASAYFDSFTKRKPYSFQEYGLSVFYKYNRCGVALGFTAMKNPNVISYDERTYLNGISVNLFADLIKLNKLNFLLSIYSNFYRHNYRNTGIQGTNTDNNIGCKFGVDYQPFKIPLAIYLNAGVALCYRKLKITDLYGGVNTNVQTRTVEIIEIGIKYIILSKRKSK